jgi:hypothetical protein
VQNNHRVSIPLERVLKLLKVKDVISYSRMNFGCPNAKIRGADYYVYWFKIVDRPNLVMNLTLFSKDSWLIDVFPVGRKASATVNSDRSFPASSKCAASHLWRKIFRMPFMQGVGDYRVSNCIF